MTSDVGGGEGDGSVTTVRELHNVLTGTGGEYWVLATADAQGAASQPPLFGHEGNLVVGFSSSLYGKLSGQSAGLDALIPEGVELIGHGHNEFEDLVGRLAADPGGTIQIWDPVLNEPVQASAQVAGHTVRFMIPPEVLARVRDGNPA